MKLCSTITFLASLALAGPALAQTEAQTEAQDEAPAPPAVGEATAGEPAVLPEVPAEGQPDEGDNDPRQVTKIVNDGGTETLYRRRGHTYEVKVAPRGGADQYLIDTNGNGQVLSNQNGQDNGGLEENTNLPKWRIGKW